MGVKVFDLQLLLGRERIMGDKPRISVESVETSGKNVYIGTNDCFIYHFVIQAEATIASERQSYNIRQQSKKHIGMKKPIVQIKAASALNQLLLNCDSTLISTSMLDFSICTSVSGKIKNISKFCINERPTSKNPFTVEICVAFTKKKILQLYQVHNDRVISMQEISLPEHPKSFCVDGKYVCLATTTAYFMVNTESGTRQELLPLGEDNKNFRMINKVASSEFLITATNGLGVFVATDGTSNRPPLQWSEGVFASAVMHPHIVALDDEFITVHSLLDQQQKQSLSFQGGTLILHCDEGFVLVCTPKDIFLLSPVPLQTQLNALIADRQVDEAVKLIKLAKRKLSADQFQFMLKRVYCMSGFICFQDQDCDRALSFFTDGCMDPRELISLFPTLLSEKSDFKRMIPHLHDIADIHQMCSNDSAQILQCQEFLTVYLEMVCNELSHNSSGAADNGLNYTKKMSVKNESILIADVIYAFVLLFACLERMDELQQFLENETLISTEVWELFSSEYLFDLVNGLKNFGCYNACALVYYKFSEIQNAMDIWRAIASKEIEDRSFPGLKFVANKLAQNCQDKQLLWPNAEWLLKLDQKAGVMIFTHLHSSYAVHVQPDDVVDFLHLYPEAVIDYLHHLVMVEKIPKEKFHTHLAVMYLERVLNLISDPLKFVELDEARKSLQEVLMTSDLYRINLILGKVKDAELFQEQVILHRKLGEHDNALAILVHKVGDYNAAKEYCLSQDASDGVVQRQLFQNMLNIYLQDISVTKGATSSTAAVLDLLNNHAENFESDNILQLLPNHWSISVLAKFLHSSVRAPLHNLRSKCVEYMLLKAELLRLQLEERRLHSSPAVIQEGKICKVCNRTLSEGAFLFYPNGTIVHNHCSRNKHICPVTGKIFRIKKAVND